MQALAGKAEFAFVGACGETLGVRSSWTRAALDVTAAVKWMRRRYQGLPLGYVSHSYGGKALGLIANNSEISRRCWWHRKLRCGS
jgi:hypothetical protein